MEDVVNYEKLHKLYASPNFNTEGTEVEMGGTCSMYSKVINICRVPIGSESYGDQNMDLKIILKWKLKIHDIIII
jgi:hypothetical protein